MKIIVIVRTKNEETTIEKFCSAYQWANRILVADGGSTDSTIEIAQRQPKTFVRKFNKTIPLNNGIVRNPSGEHINYLIEWASLYKPEWIIFDDCDCTPNSELIRNGRHILETTTKNYVFATRLFLWGETEHFPVLAKPYGDWSPGLWAWRRSTCLTFKTNYTNHTHELMKKIPEEDVEMLMPPYCLLHRPWPTEEATAKKVKYYRTSGELPIYEHPLSVYKKESLPEWAHD